MKKLIIKGFPLPKLGLKMKLTFILFIVSFFQIQANSYSQRTKITLSLDDVEITKVFKEIEARSDFKILYKTEDVINERKVSINVERTSIDDILNMIFKKSILKYKVIDKQIVIYKKDSKDEDVSQIKQPQQQKTINGTVNNESGNPLFGVTVLNTNSQRGVFTDENGKYVIQASPKDTLEFSFIGFHKEIILVNDQITIDIILKEEIGILEEVVIVSSGYQVINKERATGAYTKVSEEQLEKPTTNMGSRLIGSAAGLQAFVDENGDPEFQIRGQTSLFANQDPLIVVDGFPIQGGFNSINPNDVESVTVLKDAAAASIWGARSSNGVIVVTTKRVAKESPLKVQFSTFTKIGKKLDLDYINPLASSSETVDYEIESYNKWRAPIPGPVVINYHFFTWSQLATALFEYQQGRISEAEKDAIIARLRTSSNKGQIKDDLLASPISTQYNVNISGGSKNMSNSLSLMYEDNQSYFQETYNKEYMLNYRTTANIFKWLDFNASAMIQKNKITSNGVSLSDIQSMSPYDMLRDENGNLINVTTNYYWPIIERMVPTELFPYQDWTYNPIQEIHNRDITNEINNVRLHGGLKFKIMPELSIDTRLQYESINSNYQAIYNENTFYVRNTVNTTSSWDRATNEITLNLPMGGILNRSGAKTEVYDFRAQLNFEKIFAEKHHINFIGGTEILDAHTNSFSDPTRYGYNETSLQTGIFPNGTTGTKGWLGASQNFSYSPSFRKTTDRFFSLYSNLEYTFDNKYTLSGSYRTDASNLITDLPEYRYDPFWSIGMSWQLKNEAFLKDVSWINRLTLRGTYGFNGNIDKSTSFKPLISVSSSPDVYTGDYTASVSSFGNPSLRWEKTGTWNVGLDYSLFRGTLFGSLDVYKKEGKDLIASITIPAVNGTSSQKFNNAEMVNKGVEITLGIFQKIKGDDITWRGNLNFSYNNNKITNLYVTNYVASGLVNGGTNAYVEGENAQTLWTYIYGGLDANGKPTHLGPDGTQYNFNVQALPGDDLAYVANKGTLVAPYILGFTSDFDIYDFNLSFILTGKFGHMFKRQSFNYKGLFTTRVLPNSSLSEVRNADPSEMIPLPTSDQEPTYYLWDRYYPYMDYLAESASHLRMQEINLTYNLPLNKIFNSSAIAQIFVQGNNLFTIKANDYGEDPEYPLGSIKPEPTITFGTKLTF